MSLDLTPADGLGPLKRAALALVVATLLFGRQIAAWSVPGNRFLYFWQRGDALLLIAAILLTAVALLAVGEAVRRFAGPEVRRGFRLLFVVAFVQLVIVLAMAPNAERPLPGAGVAFLLAAGLSVAGFRRAESTLVRAAVTAGLVFAPLPPILFLQMLSWRPWRQCPSQDHTAAAPRENVPPVFVLLFDEWSLRRSTSGGEFRPELERLRRLAERSFVFSNAHSPGTVSYKAIPRILFQDTGGLAIRNGWAEWTDGTNAAPLEGRPNLFRLARAHEYRTALAGWYLPYASLVGDDLDRCRVYQQEVKREGAARLWDLFWANLQFLPDPVSRRAWRALHSRVFSETWFALGASIEADALDLARHAPDNTFAVIHYPLPHAPFIYEVDGSYRGPFPGFRLEGTVADYDRHLRYMDAVVGGFLDTLERAGRLDSALVVVTSDHSWQRDPDGAARTPERLRHVPLLIKWPGQSRGEAVQGDFCLLSLGRVIQAAIGERLSPAEARRRLNQLAGSEGEEGCGVLATSVSAMAGRAGTDQD